MEIITKSGNVLTDEDIETMAEACERGEYPGEPTGEILIGRPLMFGEDMRAITFKETKSKIERIDERASQLDMSRSDYLRHLIDADLAKASA